MLHHTQFDHTLKNSKTHNPYDMDKIKYSLNLGGVIIENVIRSLKNKWHILNNFHLKVHKFLKVVIVYYVVNNYSIEWGALKPRLSNVTIPPNNFQGFGNKLSRSKEKNGKLIRLNNA